MPCARESHKAGIEGLPLFLLQKKRPTNLYIQITEW